MSTDSHCFHLAPPPPTGSSAYSPPDAFKISIPIRNNYMYARMRKPLPELYAFTICMWLRSRSGGTGQGTPFSYSVLGQANEIVLLEAGPDPMELLINDKVSGDGQTTGMGTGSPSRSTTLSRAPRGGGGAFSVPPLGVRSTCARPAARQAGLRGTVTSQTGAG